MEKLAEGHGLIEGPLWDPARGLIYSDVIHGGVYALSPAGEVSEVFPHRRGIGGMAMHVAGGVVMSGRNIAVKLFEGEGTRVLMGADVADGVVGFNDLGTDADGRVYAGSLAFRATERESDHDPPTAHLHMIDLDGSIHTLQDGIQLTNGIAVSADGTRLYHADSLTNAVWAYRRTSDGMLQPRRVFAQVEDGIPDGIALAEDGSLWVAVAHGSRVDVFEPDGSLRKQIEVPVPMVTSVCFGGEDLRDLYVVSGWRGLSHDRAGAVFRVKVDVPGLPVPPARVPVPEAA